MKEKNWGLWHFIKSYKFNSVFVKTIQIMGIFLVVPMLAISILIYYNFNQLLKNEISESTYNSISKVSEAVNTMVDSIRKQQLWIVNDTDVMLAMMPSADKSDVLYKTANIKNLINIFSATTDYIDSINIYSQTNDNVFSIYGGGALQDFYDRSWYEGYQKNRDRYNNWVEARTVNKGSSNNEKNVISFFQNVQFNNKNVGVVITDVNMPKLRSIINSKNRDSEDIIITDNNGNIIFSYDRLMLEKNIHDIAIYKDLDINKSNMTMPINDKQNKAVVSFIKSETNNLCYISYVSMGVYEQKTRNIRNFIALLAVMTILISIIVSVFISIRFFKPVKNIMEVIEQPEKWDNLLEQNENEINLDEYNYIKNTIIKTLDYNKKMEKELEQRLLLLRKAQMVALQSQINPHFLYNTLATIQWMAIGLTNGSNKVSEMISSLSMLLKISLESSDQLATFSEEIEHAKRYIEIQKIRYSNKFDVLWDIDDKILEYKIIRISLQPIIENAIYHGMKPKEGKGCITVNGLMSGENTIVLTVSDDGPGIEEEKCQALNLDLNVDYIKESQRIGIKNVNQRIKLVFGEKYGLKIKSLHGKGTAVEITIPAIK